VTTISVKGEKMNEMDSDINQLYTQVDTAIRRSGFNENDAGPEFDEFVDDLAIALSVGDGMDLFNSVSDALTTAIDHNESSLDESRINGVHNQVFKLALEYIDKDW